MIGRIAVISIMLHHAIDMVLVRSVPGFLAHAICMIVWLFALVYLMHKDGVR